MSTGQTGCWLYLAAGLVVGLVLAVIDRQVIAQVIEHTSRQHKVPPLWVAFVMAFFAVVGWPYCVVTRILDEFGGPSGEEGDDEP